MYNYVMRSLVRFKTKKLVYLKIALAYYNEGAEVENQEAEVGLAP
jgi:hypothetical protein